MLLIGLTGGIASGKSAAGRLLARRGAVILDADEIAREVVEPGTPAHAAAVRRFGASIIGNDGKIDRPALAALVFADDTAREDLNAIVHPEVLRVIAERIESHRETALVVVVDVPLLVEAGMADTFDEVLVVAASNETQTARLVRDRGMSPEEAAARIAAQATPEARRAVATHVIENEGSLADLEAAVDRFWRTVVASEPHA